MRTPSTQQGGVAVDSSATWDGNVHFWGYFREYTTKIASTHKTPIVALRDILTEIILLAVGIIVRCSPKPASGPEVGLWRPSCTRAMQGMCGVLPTPPHTFACVPGLVPAQPRTILMRGAQGAPTSQPQQLDLASGAQMLMSHGSLPNECEGRWHASPESCRDVYRLT